MTDPGSPPASRRNFRLSVLNGALMIGTTNSVASPELVLTAFAASLTSNPIILGLIAPVQASTWSLPQFWIVGWVQRARRVLPMYTYAAVVRLVAWIALALAVLLSHDSAFLLAVLLAFVFVGGMAAGLAGLPFIEVVGKVIPPRQRGLAFGWRGALGGIVAIIGAQVVIFFTGPSAHFHFPTNYGLLFIVAGLAQMVGFFAFSLVTEPPNMSRGEHLKPSLDVVRTIWRSDGNYRHYVEGRTMFELSNTVNGLIIVYANQALGVRLELAGLYLLVSSILRPIFSAAAGRLSVRIGNRLPVAAGLLAQALGWGMLLIALPLGVRGRAAEYYMIPVYSLTAIQRGLVFSNLMALGLNVTPSGERPLYMGALNTWIGIVVLAGLFSGVMAEVIGFEALFALTAAMSCAGAWKFLTLREHWEDVAETP
ncbi:MAG TPA: MFS transporter [Aggregatilineaceae bacterium]|nr:MFS transporter [Aggregatilineaceae bacterium]